MRSISGRSGAFPAVGGVPCPGHGTDRPPPVSGTHGRSSCPHGKPPGMPRLYYRAGKRASGGRRAMGPMEIVLPPGVGLRRRSPTPGRRRPAARRGATSVDPAHAGARWGRWKSSSLQASACADALPPPAGRQARRGEFQTRPYFPRPRLLWPPEAPGTGGVIPPLLLRSDNVQETRPYQKAGARSSGRKNFPQPRFYGALLTVICSGDRTALLAGL